MHSRSPLLDPTLPCTHGIRGKCGPSIAIFVIERTSALSPTKQLNDFRAYPREKTTRIVGPTTSSERLWSCMYRTDQFDLSRISSYTSASSQWVSSLHLVSASWSRLTTDRRWPQKHWRDSIARSRLRSRK